MPYDHAQRRSSTMSGEDGPRGAMSPFEALLQLENAKAASTHRRAGTGSAVLYLRVSTQRQMKTASDVDPEGNSIATQREATVERARRLGAPIAEEFVEPGHSAQSIGKRKEFMRMLRYLEANPEVGYVIIYTRSRIFRNYVDAAVTERIFESMGITLISVKEDFGEGPNAEAARAMTDVMNGWQVRQGGVDISAKMLHKAMNGGTTGLAPLGYRNVPKEVDDGRFINGIAIDPKRAPLIKWAFAEYATGEYSLVRLQDALTELGLTTRRTPKRGERPVSRQQLAKILRDPYYVGMVRYKSEVYPGRHEPLIAPDVYERVQQVMDARIQRNQRDIVHNHFLRGMMQCGRCAAAGRSRQLIYSKATNARGEQYEYYLCAGRQDGTCDLPHLPVQLVEAAMLQEVQALQLTPEMVETMRRAEQAHLEDRLASERDARKRIKRELADLDGKEERLLDLAADGTLDTDKVKARLSTLQVQRAGLTQRLETTDVFLQQESDTLLAYLRLLERPGAFYTAAKDTVRRKLLRAYFRRIWIDDDGHQVRSDATLQPMVARIEAGARSNERTTEHALGGSSSLDRGRNSTAVCSSSNTLVHRAESFAKYSGPRLIVPPTLEQVERLAEQARALPADATLAPVGAIRPWTLRRRLTATGVADVIARYRGGERIEVLSGELGVDARSLCRLLQAEGVGIRGRPSRRDALTRAEIDDAVRLYEAGLSVRKVAKHLESSPTTIRRHLHKRGVTMRPDIFQQQAERKKEE